MELSEASYQIIAELLAQHTGQELTESRRWRVGTALAGIFRERGISNIDQLACLLAMPQETQLARDVVEALLNNETYFFRDKPTFEQLPGDILPKLAAARQDSRRLRIWCAGCSTGQEVYSLAIQFAEHSLCWDGWTIDILGTDISQKAIEKARSGLFSQFEVQRGLSVAEMLRHFDETARGWQIAAPLRSAVRFAQHNVLDAPPSGGKFDLIMCRNVLLYFAPDTRKQAFARLQNGLALDGYLMLGAGETVVGQTEIFAPSAGRASLYQTCAASSPVPLAYPAEQLACQSR